MSLTQTSSGGPIQALRPFSAAPIRLNVGATATTATGLPAVVRLISDIAVCIREGTTAASTDAVLPANVVEYVLVVGGALSCFSATGGTGTLRLSACV